VYASLIGFSRRRINQLPMEWAPTQRTFTVCANLLCLRDAFVNLLATIVVQRRTTWTRSGRSSSNRVDTPPNTCAFCAWVSFIRSTAASWRHSRRRCSATLRSSRSCSARAASSASRFSKSCRRQWSAPWRGWIAPRPVSIVRCCWLFVYLPEKILHSVSLKSNIKNNLKNLP